MGTGSGIGRFLAHRHVMILATTRSASVILEMFPKDCNSNIMFASLTKLYKLSCFAMHHSLIKSLPKRAGKEWSLLLRDVKPIVVVVC